MLGISLVFVPQITGNNDKQRHVSSTLLLPSIGKNKTERAAGSLKAVHGPGTHLASQALSFPV